MILPHTRSSLIHEQLLHPLAVNLIIYRYQSVLHSSKIRLCLIRHPSWYRWCLSVSAAQQMLKTMRVDTNDRCKLSLLLLEYIWMYLPYLLLIVGSFIHCNWSQFICLTVCIIHCHMMEAEGFLILYDMNRNIFSKIFAFFAMLVTCIYLYMYIFVLVYICT